MGRLSVSASQDYFVKDGKPFFYLGDTVWSVFSNAAHEQWEEYLDYRKAQGFNAVQISVLPVLHDASDTYKGVYPFHVNDDGTWDFAQINKMFFEEAERMVKTAYDKGFVPCLVVLWGNYAPGNWMSKNSGGSHVIPFDQLQPYTEHVVNKFSKYDPIYYISGDTSFDDDEGVRHYMEVMRTVKRLDPEGLTAFHICGGLAELPETVAQSELLDFYIYQSGHNLQDQHLTYELAQQFAHKPVKRPVLNSEPCYEGHGHGGKYGRFDAFDIRRAFWSSVLSGAKAGFTYGAHGVWSWHRKGAHFTSEGWSKTPFEWRTALRLQGAWDAGYSRWIFEQYGMVDLHPANDKLLTPYDAIRFAAAEDLSKLVLYAPYSIDIELNMDLSAYDVIAIALESKKAVKPLVEVNEESSTIRMVEMNEDAVIIGIKK